MKAKYILVGLLMVALVMGGTGYGVSAGSGDKVTGGGRFDNLGGWGSLYAGDKVSFNLQVYLLDGGAADGKFQLINHDEGTKQTGSFSSYSVVQGYKLMLVGSIDGGASLNVEIIESAEPGFDTIQIWIGKTPSPQNIDYKGQVGKGNIQWHKAKVK